MTRWLEAARKAGWHGTKGGEKTPAPSALGFCQVSSGVPDPVKPAPGGSSGFVRVSEMAEPIQAAPSEGDPETLLAWLRLHGPSTYGAGAVALGCGATRAWQAEARLRASGRVQIDDMGRTRAKGGEHE